MNTHSLLIKFKYGNKIESKSPSLYHLYINGSANHFVPQNKQKNQLTPFLRDNHCEWCIFF